MSACELAVPAPGSAPESIRLDLGGALWQMRSFAEGLHIELSNRTTEFVSRRTDSPDAIVDVHWADEFPTAGPPLFDAGLWRASSAGDSTQFDFFTHILGPETYKRAIFNDDFNSGQIFLNRRLLGTLDAYDPFEYPLDELASMHRLAHGAGVELHSCGLATLDDRGFLFVGHSGAGKSTLGKLWVKYRQAAILSDDRVVVTSGDKQYRIHGTPWHGEAGLARNASAELKAVFLIQHGKRNETIELKPAQAAVELLSRSFVPWYRARDLDFTLGFLQELTAGIPIYIFRCFPDVSAVEYLERVHGL